MRAEIDGMHSLATCRWGPSPKIIGVVSLWISIVSRDHAQDSSSGLQTTGFMTDPMCVSTVHGDDTGTSQSHDVLAVAVAYGSQNACVNNQ
eukprot:2645142-Amphidinium_carterae.1